MNTYFARLLARPMAPLKVGVSPVSTLRDLKNTAVADLATQTTADAAKVAADAAVASSTPAFAAALKAESGGESVDASVSPFVKYATTDGVTFTATPISGLDDAVTPTPTPSPVVTPAIN